MTLLVTSIFVESLPHVAEAADRAFSEGAEAVELRIDPFDGDVAELAAYVREKPHRTWIITCRSADEGGLFRGDTMERVSRLIAAARGTDAYVDFELVDWLRSSNIRQKVLLAAARPEGGGYRLILSGHDFAKLPADLAERVAAARSIPEVTAAKVAYQGRNILDSFAALDVMHEHGASVMGICMGEEGVWTRVLAKKLGAFATFCNLTAEGATAPGQMTLQQMRGLFRWNSIDRNTRVYGVIGDPVGHSRSPLLFNHWFAQAEINAVYLPLRVAGSEALGGFLDACGERSWLDVGGFSVTIPHKTAAMKWVGEEVDRLASWIGAVNTLVFEEQAVRGYNTDSYAAMASMTAALGCSRADLVGMSVDLLGAGGSARAVVEALGELGCRVTVYARSAEAAQALVVNSGVRTAAWEERLRRDGQVVINCTPLGMWPRVDESPLPVEALGGCRLVFDLVYNPLETLLLKNGRAAGCATLNGLDMFVRQAAMQFLLWTGREPDTGSAMELLATSFGAPPTRGDATWDGTAPPTRGDATEDTTAPPTRGDGTDRTSPSRGGVRRCIAIIGMRGSGKTTVGRELARLLADDFVDSDEIIAQEAGRSIAEIFAREGEDGFRRRESGVLRRVLSSPPRVLSVGGGAILDDGNVKLLRAGATVVWLTAPPEVLWRRVASDPATVDTRPPLTEGSGEEELRHVLAQRSSRFQRAGHFVVDTVDRTPAAIAREILERVSLGATDGGILGVRKSRRSAR